MQGKNTFYFCLSLIYYESSNPNYNMYLNCSGLNKFVITWQLLEILFNLNSTSRIAFSLLGYILKQQSKKVLIILLWVRKCRTWNGGKVREGHEPRVIRAARSLAFSKQKQLQLQTTTRCWQNARSALVLVARWSYASIRRRRWSMH